MLSSRERSTPRAAIMTVTTEPQPDQQPARWNDHVAVYEAVFEPLTDAFARRALDALALAPGASLIDVGAGNGGCALIAAKAGADVLAIDASPAMVDRIRQRAGDAGPFAGHVRAEVMDGTALTLMDATFDAAISVFGVILFPDPVGGLREIARVLKPGGRAAIVTWTQPERYEFAARLMSAIASVRGTQQPPSLPAQLRFREETAFRDLFSRSGLAAERIDVVPERWRLPSAHWLVENIAFAPGIAAMLGSLGADRKAVLDAFTAGLERDQGAGEITLSTVAFLGIGRKAR